MGRRALNLRVASTPSSALQAAACGAEAAVAGAGAEAACFHSQSVALPLRHAREACWTRQARAQMVTSSNAQAASAVVAATPVVTEGQMVDDWVLCLQLVDEEARAVCSGVLNRNPALLWADPHKVTAVVQVLVQATRQRNLLRPWFMQDAQILAIVDRYTPDALRARLNELHRHVWEELDSADCGSLYAARSTRDFMDLEAKALAMRAVKLRELVPEFLPSTVLRAAPELLDVLPEELPRYIHRAGDVVVVGANVRAEVQLQSPAAGGQHVVVVSAVAPPASRSALLAARHGGAAVAAPPAPPQVVRVFSNTRCLVYADSRAADVRVEDPCKAEEQMVAAGQLAVLHMCRVAAGSKRHA